MNPGGTPAGGASNTTQHSGAQDAAWARADIPLSAQETFAFLADIERLFRLNPLLEISSWQQQTGINGACRLEALNESNGCAYAVGIAITGVIHDQAITLLYDRGIKASTELRIEPAGEGSSLTITEHYHPLENQDDQRFKEVDRSLVPWLAAIRGHIAGLARYGWLPGYRWWVGRFMPGMPPRQRRMVRMMVWISLLEFIVFLCVATIFWLERQGS